MSENQAICKVYAGQEGIMQEYDGHRSTASNPRSDRTKWIILKKKKTEKLGKTKITRSGHPGILRK